MNSEVRIFFRIIGETVKGIRRAKLMNFAIVLTMAAILSIFVCLLRSSLFISNFVDEIGNNMEVSVYLKPGKNPETSAKTFLKYKNIKSIKIKTKEEAWKDFKEQMGFTGEESPLPDTIRVQLKDRKHVDKFVAVVKKLDFTEDVFYAGKLAETVSGVGSKVNMAVIIVVIALILLTFLIINNTIYLVIESRRQEIEIMRMMGVSDHYIKAPYIYQGAFYGFCGAVLAIIPLFALQLGLKNFANLLYITLNSANAYIAIFSGILMGIVVGAIGSTISVKKYLKI